MSTEVERALKIQRLQIRSGTLRDAIGADAAALDPLFRAADRVRGAGRWLAVRPAIVIGAGVALAVLRPRSALRWTRRAFVGWQAWRSLRRGLGR